jgi:hypothetical protein
MKASDTVGKETDDDLFIAAAKTVKVGTVAAPASLTKTIRIHHAEFVPEKTATSWLYTNTLIRPNTAAVIQNFYAPLTLAKGVTIVAVRQRAYRNAVGDFAYAELDYVASDSLTTIATLTHDTTGWQTKTATLSQLVGDEAYHIFASLRGAGNGGLDARLQYIEIDYTMPDYSKGV